MLYIKADEPRTLTFEVDIRGVGQGELKGYVRLFINDAEHGFPVSIDDGVITADIPPLTEVVRLKTMEDGDVIEAKLELMTDQHIFTPWAGEVKVSVPMGIKAKLSNESMKPVNAGAPVVAKVVETKEDKAAMKSSAAPVTEELRDLKTDDEVDSNYKKDLAELVKSTIQQMGLVPKVPEALMEQGSGDALPKEISKEQKENTKDLMMKKLKGITREGVYKYMHNAGTKNDKIKELVYEQSVAAAGSGEPFEVLKQVVKILKKRQ